MYHSEMSQEPEIGNGASKCEWRHAPEARGGFWEILKKSVSGVESPLGRRQLVFACSRRPWAGVARDGGGEEKAGNRKNVYLSPYVEKLLNLKVIKSFVPQLRSRKCFSSFEISMFYVIYIYIYIRTLYVHFTHIQEGVWYICLMAYHPLWDIKYKSHSCRRTAFTP